MTTAHSAVRIGTVTVGGGQPLAFIGGPCVIEGRDSALRHADAIRRLADSAGVPYIFKSSFDKANRDLARVLSRPGAG